MRAQWRHSERKTLYLELRQLLVFFFITVYIQRWSNDDDHDNEKEQRRVDAILG